MNMIQDNLKLWTEWETEQEICPLEMKEHVPHVFL